jgi:IS5 family transposase
MKITTRCGVELIDELNARLLASATEAGVVDIDWLRADTTVVPADIKYPTDSGLLVRGITKAAGLIGRIQAVGIAPRTVFDDSTATARQAAHRIGSKLRRRSEEAKAEVLIITGELADLAETTVEQARRVLANAKRVADRPVRRLRRMLADLEHLIDALGQIIAQTRLRLAGDTPPGKTRRVSLSDDDARPIRKGSLAKPTQFGYTAQVTDNRQGIVVDYEVEAGMPPDAPRLVPAIERAIATVGAVPKAVTADRGYGESSVDKGLDQFGVDLVAILRKGKTSQKRQAVETADDSPNSSNGAPDPKAGSPRRNASTAGTGPAYAAWPAPAPGAAGAFSATTRSRSPPSPADPAATTRRPAHWATTTTPTRRAPAPPEPPRAAQRQPHQPHDIYFFRTK